MCSVSSTQESESVLTRFSPPDGMRIAVRRGEWLERLSRECKAVSNPCGAASVFYTRVRAQVCTLAGEWPTRGRICRMTLSKTDRFSKLHFTTYL